jgi:xyloglucan galactosyltransferase MUR3
VHSSASATHCIKAGIAVGTAFIQTQRHVSKDPSLTQEMLPEASLPRIYVYELPANWSHSVLHDTFYWDFGQTFGRPLVLQDNVSVSYQDQQLGGSIFHRRVLNYSNRVYSPSEADLFYIPSYAAHAWKDTRFTPNHEYIEAFLPFLNASTARRHFFAFSRHWSQMFSWLGVFENSSKLAYSTPALLGDRLPPGTDLRIHHDMPYPTFTSGLSPEALKLLKDFVKIQPRPYLVGLVEGLHGQALDLRVELADLCKREPECFLYVSHIRELVNDDIVRNVSKVLLQSKFCLQPPGDSPVRKSIIDSIVMGCIPVFFDQIQLLAWQKYIPDWKAVSVFIDGRQRNISESLMQTLRSIPEVEVAAMQRNLEAVAPRITYAPSDRPGDAFEIAITDVWNSVRSFPTDESSE